MLHRRVQLDQVVRGELHVPKAALDVLLFEAEDLVLANLAAELVEHAIVLRAEEANVLLRVQWYVQGALLHLLTAQIVQIFVIVT